MKCLCVFPRTGGKPAWRVTLAASMILAFSSVAARAASQADFRGLLLAKDGGALTLNVNNKTVQTNGSTDFKSDFTGSIGFADLAVGMNLRVRGTDSGGIVTADRIDVKEPGSGREGGGTNLFRGVIESIDTPNLAFVVNGIPVQTTSYTLFRDLSGVVVNFGVFTTGQVIKVSGTPLADGRVLSGEIEMEDDLSGGLSLAFDTALEGFISAIDTVGGVVTVGGVAISVNASTRYENELSQHVTLAAFAVGDPVEVKASTQPGGGLLAVEIERKTPGEIETSEFEAEFLGTIQAVDAVNQVLTVSGRTVLAAGAVLEDRFRVVVAFDFFQPGQTVEVHGGFLPSGEVQATRIHVEDENEFESEHTAEVALRGPVQTIDFLDGTLVVQGQLVRTNEATLLLDASNQPVSLGAFAMGYNVEVEGNVQPDGSLLAAVIKIEPVGPQAGEDRVIVIGAVAAKDDATQSIKVRGYWIRHDGASEVKDRFGGPSSYAEVEIGDYVRVGGEFERPSPVKTVVRRQVIQPGSFSNLTAGRDQFLTAPAVPTGRAIGDFDGSGCTDLGDFLILLDNWQLDLDGTVVGLEDFLNLLDNWFQGPNCI